MPVTKVYDIVTNDKYELPVKYNLIGAREVGSYMGISENYVRKCLYLGSWGGMYKAIEVGIKRKTKKQAVNHNREKCREYYARHSDRIKKYQKERYKIRKEKLHHERNESTD